MPQVTLPVSTAGLVIDLYVGVSQARFAALQAAGQRAPAPVLIQAMIDTGASGTVVDASVIESLGIPQRGTIPIHTPSTGTLPKVCGQYDVALAIPGHAAGQFVNIVDNMPVIETDFSTQTIKGLVGLDVLSQGILIFNGQAGHYTLAF